MRVAAIDVGTNTVRLLVSDDGERDVERSLEITRLGQGVDATRRLAPVAIERTASAVGEFAARARELGALRVRVAGTSALRDAADADVFARRVRESAGVDLEIMAGPSEGRLAYAGATADLEGGPLVVCDIGGGSTELVGRESVCSVDVGSVRLRERFLRGDPPSDPQVAAARRFVAGALNAVVGVRGDETLVGVAGTVTTLAALVLGLERYDPARVHGSVMPASDVSWWTARLLSMTVADVKALPSMHPGRADVIASGALVLDEVMSRWRFERVLVSEHDILDGLVLDMVGRLAFG